MAAALIFDHSVKDKPILHAENLVFNRGFKTILKDISVSLYPGDVVHIKGPNGVGKTTLLNILSGLLKPHSGDVTRYAPLYFPVQPFRFRGSVQNNLERLSRIHGLSHSRKDILNVLERIEVKLYRHHTFSDLSAGYRQRLLLAYLLLFGQKALWLLDEPSSHLDTQGKALLQDIIIEHISQRGAVMFTSHHPLFISGAYPVREIMLHG